MIASPNFKILKYHGIQIGIGLFNMRNVMTFDLNNRLLNIIGLS